MFYVVSFSSNYVVVLDEIIYLIAYVKVMIPSNVPIF